MAKSERNHSRSPALPRTSARVPIYPTMCAAALLVAACGGNVEGAASASDHDPSTIGTGGSLAGGIGQPFDTGGAGGTAGSIGDTGGTFGQPSGTGGASFVTGGAGGLAGAAGGGGTGAFGNPAGDAQLPYVGGAGGAGGAEAAGAGGAAEVPGLK